MCVLVSLACLSLTLAQFDCFLGNDSLPEIPPNRSKNVILIASGVTLAITLLFTAWLRSSTFEVEYFEPEFVELLGENGTVVERTSDGLWEIIGQGEVPTIKQYLWSSSSLLLSFLLGSCASFSLSLMALTLIFGNRLIFSEVVNKIVNRKGAQFKVSPHTHASKLAHV